MMKKGKFGLSLSFIAVIAFGFAAFCQPLAVLLICGFALLAEKDEWLNKQVLQALLLVVFYDLVILVVDLLFNGLSWLLGTLHAYGAQSAMLTVNSFIDGLIYIALIVFAVIAVVRVVQGKDAGIPLLSKLAVGDLSKAFTPKPQAPVPMQTVAAQSVYQPTQYYAQPVQSVHPQPVQGAYEQPGASPKKCPTCGAPLQPGSVFCTSCGTKVE
jgi:hypothetical protein